MTTQEEGSGAELPKGELNLFIHLGLALALYLTFLVLRPMLDVIIIAAVVASLVYPLKTRLEKRLAGKESLVAFLVVLFAGLVFIVPLLFFLAALLSEGTLAVDRIQEWLAGETLTSLMNHPKLLEKLEWVRTKLPFAASFDIKSQLLEASRKVGDVILANGTAMAANAVTLVVNLFMMFFAMFFFVRDGHLILDKLSSMTPLERSEETIIFTRVREMSKSVFIGTFLTALAQGITGGIGFLFVGIPGFFWGSVMAISSLIPFVGTALVWVPAVGYLLLKGNYGSAIFILAWGVLMVGSIDNFLRPLFMRGSGGGLSTLAVFIGVVGGLSYFGFWGILYGPLILTFSAAVLELYKLRYLQRA